MRSGCFWIERRIEDPAILLQAIGGRCAERCLFVFLSVLMRGAAVRIAHHDVGAHGECGRSAEENATVALAHGILSCSRYFAKAAATICEWLDLDNAGFHRNSDI
jgi:hypothetical protein